MDRDDARGPSTFLTARVVIERLHAGPDTQVQGELGLKAFGVMGLRAYDGTLKPTVSARWMAARSTPWTP